MNTPHWTALVIFYVISLPTVANHSDDHYHTAVNIIAERLSARQVIVKYCVSVADLGILKEGFQVRVILEAY